MPKKVAIQEFTSKDNRKSASMEIHVNDMYPSNKAMPDDLRASANKISALLSDVFAQISEERRIQRDLVSGARVDPRKRHAIAVGLMRGEVDSDVIRPYYRRDNQPVVPTISIIASAGLYEVTQSYMQTVGTLGIGLSWACEAVGIKTTVSFLEGHDPARINKPSTYRDANIAYTMIDEDSFTPLQKLNAAFDPALVTTVGWTGVATHPDCAKIMNEMSGKLRYKYKTDYKMVEGKYVKHKKKITYIEGSIFPSQNGGNGVHWARTVKQAEMVIAIGNFTDAQDADIHLASNFDLMTAVKEIGKQARQLTVQ